METKVYEQLARLALPKEILDRFEITTTKPAAMLNMARWYDKVEKANIPSFNVIAKTFHEHYSDILNFYHKRSTNATAE